MDSKNQRFELVLVYHFKIYAVNSKDLCIIADFILKMEERIETTNVY